MNVTFYSTPLLICLQDDVARVKYHYVITHTAAWINSGAAERAKAGDDAEELR